MSIAGAVLRAADLMGNETPSLNDEQLKREIAEVVVEEEVDDGRYERRICGFKLPSYFNHDPDRKLVRKLDTYIL